jgi:putative transposase
VNSGDDEIDVAVACRVLEVSRSGYYDWCSRPASARDQENELLLKHIERIHADSRETYCSPRVHAELTLGFGLVVNLKRVARGDACRRHPGPLPASTPRLHDP